MTGTARPQRHRPAASALRGLIGAAVLLAAVEGLTRAELVNPATLPPASAILTTTGRILLDPEFLTSVGGTLLAWAIGMLIAAAMAVPLGVLLGSSRRSYLAATMAIEFLRPIPSVALIPLVILLRGRGLDFKVILIVYASVWPILFNTIYGMRDVDPQARETARAYGLNRIAILWRISLRAASPFIYTGVRISAGIALILAISAELIAGGGPGIGTWMIANSQAGVPREFLYAGIVVSGLLGVAINRLMVAGEHRLFAWHHRVRGSGS
ncbi:MAG TPA: ABC transporter permease [Candidatus Limnocylindria bacterium]|nr:ABC transporter permease [Candidatus Limnocylindria bacterium]